MVTATGKKPMTVTIGIATSSYQREAPTTVLRLAEKLLERGHHVNIRGSTRWPASNIPTSASLSMGSCGLDCTAGRSSGSRASSACRSAAWMRIRWAV